MTQSIELVPSRRSLMHGGTAAPGDTAVNRGVRLLAWVGAAVTMLVLTGCQSAYNGHGIVYGCDGSGAGVVIRWGPSARQGLIDGGYKGVTEAFRWQTGGGVLVDHSSSPEYKRMVAGKLAERITQHAKAHPGDPIYLAGLSAGCAVVLYALEELPPGVNVDQVVLLSSSVSAGFDLNKALSHVRGRIYAFTSSRDVILSDLASRVGTADGMHVGTDISGIRGFHEPGSRGSSSQSPYGGRVQNIPWRPEFAKYGHRGGHTDVVAAPFVAKYVAPLVVPAASDRRGT